MAAVSGGDWREFDTAIGWRNGEFSVTIAVEQLGACNGDGRRFPDIGCTCRHELGPDNNGYVNVPALPALLTDLHYNDM